MEAEVASLGSQLQEAQVAHQEEMQVAKDGAKLLLKELADEKKSKLNMELQNGRAAMFGVLGLMMQDAVNGEVTIFPGTDIA